MEYQVWIKDEFGDTYTKVDCGDLAAAKREIDAAYKTGKDPMLTVEVPYSLAIKVEDVGAEKPRRRTTTKQPEEKTEKETKSEADKSETEPGESPGTESQSEV